MRRVHGATVEQSYVGSLAMRALCLETGAASLFAVDEDIGGRTQIERALTYFHHSCPRANHVMAHDLPTRERSKGGKP